ncbi:MAG: hypothetical protein JWN04_5589, partial [Myxococcaceae bacterium]|nr:hypothetical protein [Myxococcaceae bacterium]
MSSPRSTGCTTTAVDRNGDGITDLAWECALDNSRRYTGIGSLFDRVGQERVVGLRRLDVPVDRALERIELRHELPALLRGGAIGAYWPLRFLTSDIAFYRIDPSRGHQVIVELLDGFEGLLVVDGYQPYATEARVLGGRIRLALCWAHARRTLVEAEESYPEASEALDLIGEMFLIERDLPDWRCITDDVLRTRALEQIRETRQTRTRPLVEALAAWARAQRALKGSRLGEAVTYLHNQWDGLLVFLDDPRVPLSNNSAERS